MRITYSGSDEELCELMDRIEQRLFAATRISVAEIGVKLSLFRLNSVKMVRNL